jgi:hypothetical protein
MKRFVFSAAFAAVLFGSAGTAMAAQPTPTPMPSIEVPTVPSVEPMPGISLDPNTEEVCGTSRDSVNEGLQAFTDELGNAGTLATNGDLVGAEASVKRSGTVLIDLASQLRTDATDAENTDLKTALENVAKELDTLGGGLTSLTSLQTFDSTRLETLAARVAELCGSE